MRKKIISFSLFGSDEIYIEGAFENLRLQKIHYPDWQCHFFVSHDSSKETIEKLLDGGAKVTQKKPLYPFDGLFWRFLPMDDPDVDCVIFRDADSRLGMREALAVNEWLQSGESFHLMRDHLNHRCPVMAGMFGFVRKNNKNTSLNMKEKISAWNRFEEKEDDQAFLKTILYPLMKDDCYIHSDLIRFKGETAYPFPSKRVDGEFVGCQFTASNALLHPQLSASKYFPSKLKIWWLGLHSLPLD